jgi:HD-GYP domain-containing protein (c-di-GMP phosphodiesterase class II)
MNALTENISNLIQIPRYSIIILAVLIITCLVLVAVINSKTRKINDLKIDKKLSDDLISGINPMIRIEDNLMNILGVMSKIIEAQSYALYILDERSNNYILKAVRNTVYENGKVGPGYSGLLPYKKEGFILPPSLPTERVNDTAEIIMEGELKILLVPIKGKKGIVLIGPVKKVSEQNINLMNYLGEKSSPLLSSLLQIEELKNRIKFTDSSDKAIKKISNLFSSYKGMMDMIIASSMQTIGASLGIFIKEENGVIELETAVGLDEKTEKSLSEDTDTQFFFSKLVKDESIIHIEKGDKNFFKIPPYLAVLGMGAFILINVDVKKGKGIAVFALDDFGRVKEYQKAALLLLAKRMGDILINYKKFKELSSSYVDILKMLAKLVDNLSIYNVGYSDLMYKYAQIISKEMKLSSKEIEEISLAAYFSNIGVIGLSDDIINKKGKYDQSEYEMMKHHADAGAAIIEATIGNKEIANYIKYHHERIDGNGYPENLKGEEIPVGSRIIAVIQTFLAKILGRSYRDPLSFEDAIEQIKTAEDTQLDSEVTESLIKWFEKNKKNSTHAALGPCYELRCSPKRICMNCDAYQSKDKNCWEFTNNNCVQHGNTCDKCFVYGEYKYRISAKNG